MWQPLAAGGGKAGGRGRTLVFWAALLRRRGERAQKLIVKIFGNVGRVIEFIAQ